MGWFYPFDPACCYFCFLFAFPLLVPPGDYCPVLFCALSRKKGCSRVSSSSCACSPSAARGENEPSSLYPLPFYLSLSPLLPLSLLPPSLLLVPCAKKGDGRGRLTKRGKRGEGRSLQFSLPPSPLSPQFQFLPTSNLCTYPSVLIGAGAKKERRGRRKGEVPSHARK